jgi:tetratricopeptide (TPR) repeat protein
LVAAILARLGSTLAHQGDFASGRAVFWEALGIYKTLSAGRDATNTLTNLAELEFLSGDAETALRHTSDVLAMLRECNARVDVTTLINRSAYFIALGMYDEAEVSAREAIAVACEQQRDAVVAFALQHLAAIAALRPELKTEFALDIRRAARILGFVDGRLTAFAHVPRDYTERQEYDRVLAELRDAIAADELETLMADGAAMTQEQAIEAALSLLAAPLAQTSRIALLADRG